MSQTWESGSPHQEGLLGICSNGLDFVFYWRQSTKGKDPKSGKTSMSSSSPFPQLPVRGFYPSRSPQPPPSPRVREDPPGLPHLWGGSAVSVPLQDFVIAFYSSHAGQPHCTALQTPGLGEVITLALLTAKLNSAGLPAGAVCRE